MEQHVRITKDKETYLTTVYGKALDNRSPNPILGDRYADEALKRIDFDFSRIHVKGGEISLPVRAKHFDGWTREFLATDPTSTVLHLGCGLDSRVFRIDPAGTVRWYDVDMPDVIDLRTKVYPARPDYQMIGTSVADLRWLDDIPGDRPVLVVAEGFMQYLPERDLIALLDRITKQFPHGDILFDAYNGAMTWGLNRALALNKLGYRLHWSAGDSHFLETRLSRIKLVDAIPFMTLPELVERLSRASRYQRIVGRMLGQLAFYQRMVRHFRYRF
jgi:O-methyltransferase involved in polyketide biosynthesis